MISIGTLFVILGWIWYASAKTTGWDGTTERVKEIEPVVEKHTAQLDVLTEKLDDIQEDVRYLRRHAK